MMDAHCLFNGTNKDSLAGYVKCHPPATMRKKSVTHRRKMTMPTGNRNGKSVKLYARVPLELANDIEELKEDGESVASFLIQALQAEAERRKEIKRRSGVSGWA